MRLAAIAVLLVSTLSSGCMLRPKSIPDKVKIGELAFRINRTDGVTYVVQIPSMTTIRSVLNELNCGKNYGCNVELVRVHKTAKGDGADGEAVNRATIRLLKDTQAGDALLPAGTYEVYFNTHTVQPKVMFMPVDFQTERAITIAVGCKKHDLTEKSRATEVLVDDVDSGRAELKKIQIRGDLAAYSF